MKSKNQLIFFVLLLIIGFSLVFTANSYLAMLGGILILYALAGIRVIYEFERGVIFTLGNFDGLTKPGLIWVAPIIQNLAKVDLRVRSVDLPKQEVMTKDNVPVKVNATVFFKVEDPKKAILNVENYEEATILYSQTVLRDVIGGVELDELLQNREKIAEEIRKIVDEITDEWGIKVTGVRLQDIELPEELKRAMARQAEAEREKRAIIIKSQGEVEAVKNFIEAAKKMEEVPAALHLRTLYTLADISTDPNQKTVILLPIEMLKALQKFIK